MTFAESLHWFSRSVVLDQRIFEMQYAYSLRFEAQSRFFIRRGVPKIRELLIEAKRKPPQIETAVSTLDEFQHGLSVQSYERNVPEAFVAGANQAVRDLGSFASFTAKNPLVLEYLRQNGAAKLGRDVDATTKDRLRALLVKGQEEGWTLRQTTREIRDLYDGFTRTRAEVIAVHEIGNAYSSGSLGFALDAASAGMEVEKYWGLAANPCPICEGNAAAGWIDVHRAFPSGAMAPLQHVRCRCSLMTRPKANQ